MISDVQRGTPLSNTSSTADAAAQALRGPANRGALFGRGRALRATGKILPEHARRHNRALVLQTLYGAGAQSRADIARETGLTRVTVSDLVAELIAEHLVVELGQREDARPGKPATMIDIDRGAFHIIGVDLSDDAVFRGAVLDLDGGILERAEVERAGATGELAVEKVAALIETLLSATSTPLLGIGIGSPGVVDANGVVRSAPNLAWYGLALQDLLARRFGLPVHVANDANAATLAEHGSRESDDDLMLIKVGHGVGAGLLVGGRALVGGNFAAGEIGHVVVGTDEGPLCVCGKRGCLEAWLAAPRLSAEIERLSASDTGETLEEGRERILREAGRRLGIVLAPVVAALNLSEIVLSGPVDLLDGALKSATIETLNDRMMAEFNTDLRLRMTSHGQDIVMRGAAVMVLSGQLGVS